MVYFFSLFLSIFIKSIKIYTYSHFISSTLLIGSNLTFELTHDNINLYYNFQPLKIHYENQVVTSITLQQLEKLFK